MRRPVDSLARCMSGWLWWWWGQRGARRPSRAPVLCFHDRSLSKGGTQTILLLFLSTATFSWSSQRRSIPPVPPPRWRLCPSCLFLCSRGPSRPSRSPSPPRAATRRPATSMGSCSRTSAIVATAECKQGALPLPTLPPPPWASLLTRNSYAELIQNRAFQGSTEYPTVLAPWTAIGPAALALDNSSSLSSALPTSVAVTASADGLVGIKNPGWWGSK